MIGVFTVTEHAAVFPPSSVFTVIVALPAETAVTLPVASTLATPGALLDQPTCLFVASAGATVAVSWPVSPTISSIEHLSSATPVTWIISGSGGSQ